MSQWLKKDTACTIMFGPFVDKTDGVTLEVGAGIITSIDHATTGIFLSKNGGTAAIRHQTVTASVLDAYGMFKVTLDTTDTNTVGTLDVLMAEAATFLPVHKAFMVLPALVYDSLMGADNLQVDIIQIGGVAQSATDLKDFVDTGYDPSAHKVQGVVTVDTTTTNTDMRGTDSAALASGYTATRAGYLDELAAANIPSDVDAITGYVDCLPATLNNISTAEVNTEVDNALNTAIPGSPTANSINERVAAIDDLTQASGAGDLAAILTDTGTTLDGIVDDILVDTAEIGTAGAGLTDLGGMSTTMKGQVESEVDDAIGGGTGTALTAVPWNSAWDAEVQSECADALTAYDPPTKAEMDTAHALLATPAQVNTEVDNALNTAIPGSPTANSINERIAAIDDLTQASGGGDLAAIKAKTDLRPSGIPKNVALSNFQFLMVLASDHYTPATSKTITAQISKDGGALATCTNSASEIGNGIYKISLTQTEMNATVITLRFTEANCDQTTVTIVTST